MIPLRNVNVYLYGQVIARGEYSLEWLNLFLNARRPSWRP